MDDAAIVADLCQAFRDEFRPEPPQPPLTPEQAAMVEKLAASGIQVHIKPGCRCPRRHR